MIVDIIIAVLLIFALVRGRELGLVRQFFSAVGFFAGLIIGALIQPHVVQLGGSPSSRLLLTLVVTMGFGIIFLSFGEIIGIIIKRKLFKDKKAFKSVDSGLGSIAGGASLLVAVWLAAAVLIALPFNGLQNNLKKSFFISKLDETLPAAPSIIAKLGYLINPNSFPRVFLGGEPTPPKNIVSPVITGQLRKAVNEDAKSVVRIEGLGCGGLVEGSGFVFGQDLVATNAHVVAGIKQPYITDANGQHAAKVISFDPDLDFAILKTSNLAGEPLVVSARHVDPNTTGAIMGYPNGGGLESDGATVVDTFIATGRNIYNQGTTSRHVIELGAPIVHGNSGGPFITEDGSVIGVVFAKSTSYKNVGYALAAPQVKDEMMDASSTDPPVSTGECTD